MAVSHRRSVQPGIGLNRLPDMAEYVMLGLFAATLIPHVYVFKSKKFRKKK